MRSSIRNMEHRKQSRMQVRPGVPLVAELQEGVPTLRNVDGVGLVEYVRYNGELYSKSFQKYEPAKYPQDIQISKLTDNTGGDFSNVFGASTYGVTQGTNATTGVTLNANAGIITTYAATIAENTEVEFVVTNNKVKSTSTIILFCYIAFLSYLITDQYTFIRYSRKRMY